MSKLIARKQCPACFANGKDTAGDNLGVYDDGHSWCFACGYLEGSVLKTEPSKKRLLELPETVEAPLKHKSIGVSVMRQFKVFKEKNSDWYVYPYYNVEKYLVGIKYRNFLTKGDKKNIHYDGEVELFGFAAYSSHQKECILWEGESDTLSGYQVNPYYAHFGFPGSGTREKLLKRHAYWLRQNFTRIYVCVHNDPDGELIREAIDEYLPAYLVYHMYVDDAYKDFNECLQDGRAVKELPIMLRHAKSPAQNDLLTGTKLLKSFRKYADNPSLFNGYSTGFPSLDRMIGGGLHVGEVFALVGHTGRGKSTFARDIAMNISENMPDDERILWIGTEMDHNLMIRKFLERECATPFGYNSEGQPTIPVETQNEVISRLSQKFVFYTELSGPFDQLESAILNAVLALNVRVVVIDVLSDISDDFTDWTKASQIITRLHKVAQGNLNEKRPMISIFCVSHTIGSDEAEVTLSNLRGGSAIRQKVTGAISFDGDINEEIRIVHRLKKSRVYDGDANSASMSVFFDTKKRRYYEVADRDRQRKSKLARILGETSNGTESNGESDEAPLRRKKRKMDVRKSQVPNSD